MPESGTIVHDPDCSPFDPLAEWRRVARSVDGGAIECGHYIAEEAPEALLSKVLPLFAST